MDIRIQNEADLQKLVHCEILKVEQSIVNGVICFGFVFRSIDEVIFQLYLMPGVNMEQVAGQSKIMPTLAIVTREVIETFGGNAESQY